MVLTVERLRDVLDYNPFTGWFVWRLARSDRRGARAGSPDHHGYVCIKIDGQLYKAHRLAWLYIHGRWPLAEIDHKNGRTDDNRLRNLREAKRGQNQANARTYSSNKIGLKGVHFHAKARKWVARVQKDGMRQHLGLFSTAELAHAAYRSAAARLHGEFARDH
jgi:hypothetical protein